MSAAIVIQARTGSSRLPEKMILPFIENIGVFEIVVKRIADRYKNEPVYLATTSNINDDVLVGIAQKYGLNVYRGSEDNVLSRFTGISEKHNYDSLIRVCADNPFLETEHIGKLIEEGRKNPDVDYISFAFPDGTPTIKSHLGLFTEYVKSSALKRVEDCTEEKLYLEHVTNYVYSHNDSFSIKLLPLPENLQSRKDIRLTLDTKEDFEVHKQIWKETGQSSVIDIDKILNFIDNNSDIAERMKIQIEENSK